MSEIYFTIRASASDRDLALNAFGAILNLGEHVSSELTNRMAPKCPAGAVAGFVDNGVNISGVVRLRASETAPSASSGPRTIKAPDGREIEVLRDRLSIFQAWAWLWRDGVDTFMGPMVDGCIKPLDHEPTDAEVIADYLYWLNSRDVAPVQSQVPTFPRIVTLAGPDGRERYATVSGISGLHVLVTWEDDVLHYFSNTDGRCLESSNGIMRGWRIHPDELPRFQRNRPVEAAVERVVVADDGMRLLVSTSRPPLPIAYKVRVANGINADRLVAHLSSEPTDAEVCAAYNKWSSAQRSASRSVDETERTGERVVEVPDGARVDVRRSDSLGFRPWVTSYTNNRCRPGRTYGHCPTDAEVLADYEAWKKARASDA